MANPRLNISMKKFLSDPILGVIILLLLVGGVASFTVEVFFTLQNFTNFLSWPSVQE